MKRILITGGAGFIGSRLAKKLKESRIDVVVLDNLSPQIHDVQSFADLESIGVECILGDVCDRGMLDSALEGVDGVVHLAAETGTGQSMYDVDRYSRVNIQATATLMELVQSRKDSIKKIVVASSRAIFGEGAYLCGTHGKVFPNTRMESDMNKGDFEPKCPQCASIVSLTGSDESTPYQPSSFYGLTKQVQEQTCLMLGTSAGVPTTALRYQNVYGPGQSLKNPYTGILSIFSNLILNQSPINIFEDGLESRDFVYVSDVVDATVLALLEPESDGQVFNIGSGVATSVLDVVSKLFECYKLTVPVEISGDYRIGDIRHNYADISKAINLLGFKPKVDFGVGITEFCRWVESMPIGESKYKKSIEELDKHGLLKRSSQEVK